MIVHDNPREIEWLIQPAKAVVLKGTTQAEVADRLGRRVLELKDHPDLVNIKWPLNEQDFW